MDIGRRKFSLRQFHLPAAVLLLCATASSAWADKFLLVDGRELEGRSTQLNSMKSVPGANDTEKLLVMIDNDLCRTYIPLKSLAKITPAPPDERQEIINIQQPAATDGQRITGIGNIIEITPWDADGLGRRVFSMTGGTTGRADVVQGITKITPVWCRIDSLQSSKITTYLWDERLATSSIPTETLLKIINRNIDPKNVDDRLKIVRLYLLGQRYKEAEAELKKVQQDFPDRAAGMADVAHDLKQLGARQVLDEIDLRRKAGQHQLAYSLLSQFPSEGVDGSVLQKVRAKLDEYNEQINQGKTIAAQLAELTGKLSDSSLRGKIETLVKEITDESSINTLDRLSTYRRFADDTATPTEGKLALAISGWLTGAENATDNLSDAVGMGDLRNLVRNYLQETSKPARNAILAQIQAQESASAKRIAAIVAHMLPHIETPPQATPGFFELATAGANEEAEVHYWVQLPPEYDPHYSYPCIFALHGEGSTPKREIEWWAGDLVQRGTQTNRTGQAARHGYIVIAPEWGTPHQTEFLGTAREHNAILSVYRDACRRFAIDTDRVFLAGISAGGTAAWELGLSHPDLWAGVIPFVATANKQVQMYKENAEKVPLYFVCGELDGDKMVKNGPEFDRYMNRNVAFDCTVAEFEGRGHEHFSDEILRLFDWMGRKQRNFFPKQIENVTTRATDNYFWWLELRDFQPGGKKFTVKASLTATNGVMVNSGGKVTVWLAPEMVDFNRPITVTQAGNRLAAANTIRPDLAVLLEDVRARGDRKHPFWAKVE